MFFFKKDLPIGNFGFLEVDMHNHVLPGIDDGAQNVEESLKLLSSLKQLGFAKVIPTPHTMHHVYPNNAESITNAQKTISSAVNANKDKYPTIVECASEYLLDEMFPNLRGSKKLLSFAHDHILIEMSYAAPSPVLEEEIYQLQMAGYKPVLAHPERYSYLRGSYKYYESLVRKGCQFQLNLISLTEFYGKATQKTALKLLEMQLYHWAGTDAHNDGHIQQLHRLAESKHFKLLERYSFNNKLVE